MENSVFYQIYPQSFLDTNADGIGDLEGVIRKLGYIKELGCNAIWLNPCFDSPFYDAGYDVRDYKKIAPRYGTNEDMHRLLSQAHALDMKVVLDLVPGHTSIDHEWFKKSMRHDPEYKSRYIWTEDPHDKIEVVEGLRGTICGFSERGHCAVNYFSTQPALNYGYANPDPQKPWEISYDSPDAVKTRTDILDVMRFWLDMGCDGFRVDMAFSLVKGDKDYTYTKKLWQEIRTVFDAVYPDAALISEWGDPEHSLAAGFHMDFLLHFGPSEYNSLFRSDPFFASSGRDSISSFIAGYDKALQASGGNGMICLPSGNHDMPRISHHLSTDELRLAFAFLLSIPGAPFIYYGDEIGMRYIKDQPSIEGGYKRTGSRTPMQWNTSLNAGFSSASQSELYIPLDTSKDRPDAQSQMADTGSLWHEVKKLIALRRQYKSLQNMSPVEFISHGENKSPLAYKRSGGDETIFVALNPSSKAAEMKLSSAEKMRIIYTVGKESTLDNGIIKIPATSGIFLASR